MDATVIPFKNRLLKSCSYIIDYDGLWLIDCGGYQQIVDYIGKSEKLLKGILITHCHQDHIYGFCEI